MKTKEYYKTSVNIRDKKVWDKLKKYCRKEGLHIGVVLEKIILSYLNERGVK